LIALTVAAIRVCCRLFIPLILCFLFDKTELKANHILLEDMQCKKKGILGHKAHGILFNIPLRGKGLRVQDKKP
jgi:hypothetical protein